MVINHIPSLMDFKIPPYLEGFYIPSLMDFNSFKFQFHSEPNIEFLGIGFQFQQNLMKSLQPNTPLVY